MGQLLSAYLCPHPPIILKEIGEESVGKVQDTIDAMDKISLHIKEKKPDTLIVITPHGPIFRDAIAIGYEKVLKGDFGHFGHSEISFYKDNNRGLVDSIIRKALEDEIYCVKLDEEIARQYDIPVALDHGVLVPLYFIDKVYSDYNLVHITYGILSPLELYRFGMIIREAVEERDKDAVIIASGDLSHRLTEDGPYPYSPRGAEFDETLITNLKEENYGGVMSIDKALVEEAGECGLRSIQILLGTMDGYETHAEILSYEGSLGVGYGVGMFQYITKKEDAKKLKILLEREESQLEKIKRQEDAFVQLARKSLETYIKTGRYLTILSHLPQELINRKSGVFVSIKKDGELRGCIGTTGPTTNNIAEEIIHNAIQAGTQDPRFFPVEEKELEKLIYSVDVLGNAEVVESIEALDEKRYGVIVTSGKKRGLLLPNLEGVTSVEEQIDIALQKANIHKGEDYTLERFEVIRHH